MNPFPDNVVIRCEGLSKRFGPVLAVDRVDLEVEVGRTLALIGPSGCGKTTTLRLLAGFEMPDSGLIHLAGRVVTGPGVQVPPERRGVGMVFQDYALFPHLDVAGNVGFGLRERDQRARRVAEVLELVGLAGLERRFPHELSGGQQQRVALARALAPKPALLLLDEPFSNLDAALRSRVRADVGAILSRAGATTIFVTHDQDEALSLADEVAIMEGGGVLQVGRPEDVYRRPAHRQVALLLGEANVLPGEITARGVASELGCLAPLVPMPPGRVDVVVRPEDVILESAPAGVAGMGEVIGREYYGHDQRLQVRLRATGTLLTVRTGPEFSFHVGDQVGVRVCGPVSTFPSDFP